MTILPKKKHQESRKSEQDQDIENRNRTRTRPRETRNRAPPTDDLDAAVLETSSNALSLPVYNDLDTRDSQEGPSLPHKRNRHKPAQGFFLPPSNSPTVNNTHSRSGSRETSVSPSREADQDGYNSSDEHGPRSFGAKVKLACIHWIHILDIFKFCGSFLCYSSLISSPKTYFDCL